MAARREISVQNRSVTVRRKGKKSNTLNEWFHNMSKSHVLEDAIIL